ncbi:MAG TPA: hypothetical protein DEQ50_05165 [Lactobacillus sp.]|nr:hypothetical protein [Lactobacillus sp.]
MATNKLTEVAGLVAQAVMGAKVKDKDGNTKTVKPTGDDNLLDLTDIVAGGSTGGNTGDGTTPDVPTAGADYYAGSLADGEITERYLLYQRDESVAEQTGSQTVTLLRDVGSTFNMAGDGATFLIHLQRTAMTKGAKGAVTDIELNYDPNNVVKDGYFTTTSPYPVYTKSADLATKKTLAVPINGIGEKLSGKNVKAPQLNILFNGNGTLTFESVTGYDNDGDSAGATGANYEVVVDAIATFSTQPAVAQLPSSVKLYTGEAEGDIALSGISDNYENAMDGIKVYLTKYMYIYSPIGDYSGWLASTFGIPSLVSIDKKHLIIGFKIKLNNISFSGDAYQYTGKTLDEMTNSKITAKISDGGENSYITIQKGSINLTSSLYTMTAGSNGYYKKNDLYKLRTTQINTYKD